VKGGIRREIAVFAVYIPGRDGQRNDRDSVVEILAGKKPQTTMNKLRPLLTAFVTILLLAATATRDVHAAAEPAASNWDGIEQTSVRLVAASEMLGDDGKLHLGLHFKMKPGWKIYWRSPGDAGFPPSADWDGSRNLMSANIVWPAPGRFSVLGFETLGYKEEVVLPIHARTIAPGQAADLKAAVKFLTCDDICIPYEAKLAMTIPAGPEKPSAFAHAIARFQSQVPGSGDESGVFVERVAAPAASPGTLLRVTATASEAFRNPDVYFEGERELAFAKPAVSLSPDGKKAVFDVAVSGLEHIGDGSQKTLAGKELMVTLVDGNRSSETRLSVVPGTAQAAPPPSAAENGSLAVILILALIGGLILNLMPCVLPVLSIKLLGVVGHGGGEARMVRMSFLASSAGILAAFLVLAGALAALKAGGALVGWGIQFQQPWFLIAMTLIVVVFACNLWGWFEVRLPMAVSDLGEHATHVHGLGGHFLQGVFATLLATPCSAPFLGTAVGFALSRGTVEIFAVFTALAVGLALPYLAVALYPALATRLPKPGQWMVRLRQVLGFALAATALWLLSVLAVPLGITGAGLIGALMVAVTGVLYWAHRGDRQPGRAAAAAVLTLAIVSFLVPALPAPLGAVTADNTAPAEGRLDGVWQPFDEAAIGRMVAAGQTVLVDVTADWCITCQVNKKVVLARDPVLSALKTGEAVAMQADWTLPSDAIARYLAGFGRYGIPFNAVYGPKAPAGIPLPELLTTEVVMKAISEAAGD